MNELVVLNGIIQSPHAYMMSGNTVVFHSAPEKGVEVSIVMDEHRYSYVGDGSTFVFPGAPSDRMQFKKLMEDVYEKRNDPAVKDQLEKLKIVMELVR